MPHAREERYDRPRQNTFQQLYFEMYRSIWDSIRPWMYVFVFVLLFLSALIISLWLWWVIWYIEERPECCGDDDSYKPEEEMCNDTGQYVSFECFNQSLCEALGDQGANLGCLGDVNISYPKDGDIINWNSTTNQWENEVCDPCTNGTNGINGINGINGTDGINGGDGADGDDGDDGIDGTDGVDGDDGLNCWDINENGLCDLQVEDVNSDGVCNQTDCIGDTGEGGLDGRNATIDECEKPFGQLCLVDGATPDVVEPLVLNMVMMNTWYMLSGSSCMIKEDKSINVTMMGCSFTITHNDSYKITIDTSFVDNTPSSDVIWVGLSVNGADPMTKHAFPSDDGHVHTMSFSLAMYLTEGDTLSVKFYSLNSTGFIDVLRLQFTAVGELLCGFDVTGEKGEQGLKGDKGDDGYHCWDLNENYFCDLLTEDINEDGICSVNDCTLANITYANITGDICPVLEEGANITCMSDVNITETPGEGEYMCWNTTLNQWVNGPITYEVIEGDLCPELGAESIDCMGDVNAPSPINGTFLKGDGINWTPANITYTDIEGDLCPELGVESIDCIGDVNAPSPINGTFLKGDGINWTPANITYTDIVNTNGTEMCDSLTNNGVHLSCLIDVDFTGGTPNDNDILIYNNITEKFEPGENVAASAECSSKDNSTGVGYINNDHVILFYNFKELEGNTTKDASGFGSPVDLFEGSAGSPDSMEWWYPNGLRIDVSSSSSAHVWRSGTATADKVTDAIKVSGEYSVEIWLQVTDSTQDNIGDPANFFVIGKNGGTACNVGEQILAIGQGSNEFVWRLPSGGSCNAQIFNNMFFENHLPIQIVLTYDGTNTAIYRNGKLRATGTETSNIGTWTDSYEISIFNNPWLVPGDQEEWDGILRKVVMWDQELTQEQITETFKTGPEWPRECTCSCS
ncbi:MAG: LamG-like jellyroll fold domain-containing protein [Promethearchaeota archaeon]